MSKIQNTNEDPISLALNHFGLLTAENTEAVLQHADWLLAVLLLKFLHDNNLLTSEVRAPVLQHPDGQGVLNALHSLRGAKILTVSNVKVVANPSVAPLATARNLFA